MPGQPAAATGADAKRATADAAMNLAVPVAVFLLAELVGLRSQSSSPITSR